MLALIKCDAPLQQLEQPPFENVFDNLRIVNGVAGEGL